MTVLQIPQSPAAELGPFKLAEPSVKELEAYQAVFAHFENVQDSLTEAEKFFLTKECLYRYIRATKANGQEAITRLQKTLDFRREWNVDTDTPDFISPEQETGKQLVYGFDNAGRPFWIMRPNLQNTPTSDRQLHHMIYFMNLAILVMPQGVEKCSLLVNFNERSTGPTWSTSKKALSILQDHFPERLGRAHIINLPWIVQNFFKLISPFIDPKTREKLAFNNSLASEAPSDHLEKAFGGNVEFGAYDHESYWKDPNTSIIALALGRKEQMLTRWRELGAKVGISETDIKQGM